MHLRNVTSFCIWVEIYFPFPPALTVFQEALAEGLEYETKLIGTEKSYWKWLTDTLEAKKAKTVKMAESAGMTPIVPEGGYFMMADISSFGKLCIYQDRY